MKIRIGLCMFLAILVGAPTSAKGSEGRYPWEEFDSRLAGSSKVPALGPDLMGDQVSLSNGGLAFSVTDMALPGNNALPVAASRRYTVSNRWSGAGVYGAYRVTDGMLADWDIEIPNINGVFMSDWLSASAVPGNRCSSGTGPKAPNHFSLKDFWTGIHLDLPAGAGGELLSIDAGTPSPSDGRTYRWVAGGHVRLACLSTIKNGEGEGFLAVTPDGIRYWLDWMGQTTEASLKKRVGTSWVGHPIGVTGIRKRNALYVTRVEDRFGNYVDYTYTNAWNQPAKLSTIQASDGRRLTLSYSGQHVSSITDGSRVWDYSYQALPGGRSTLYKVILPDTSSWTINFGAFTNARIEYRDSPSIDDSVRTCTSHEIPLNWNEIFTGSIEHPSGGKAEFSVGLQEHGRSFVPKDCDFGWMEQGAGGIPYDNNSNDDVNRWPISYYGLTLQRKRVYGATLDYAWDYSYVPNISHYSYPGTGSSPTNPEGCDWANHDCSQPPCTTSDCALASITTVSGPSGAWQRYHYGNTYRYNEGKLLKVESGGADSGVLDVVDHEYDLSQLDHVYPARLGTSRRLNGDGFQAEYQRPLVRSVRHRQGVAFEHLVESFDWYARPTRVTRRMSGGPARSEQMQYHDNTVRWILGQLASVACVTPQVEPPTGCGNSGFLMLETSYDSDLAVPLLSKQFGKTVRSLSWDRISTVASGQRGTLRTVADGKGHTITLTDWKRGIPQSIRHPATVEAPAGATQSASVSDAGWITAVTNETGATTSYQHDLMGRLTRVTHPTEDPVHGTVWNATTHDFSLQAGIYGLPTHWRWLTSTGSARTVIHYDALWRPVVEETYDNANPVGTRTLVVKRYDTASRLAFQSHPLRTLADYAAVSAGTFFEYDALGRATKTRLPSVDAPGGFFTTTTEYLPNFVQRVTSPNLSSTTTRFMAWDEPVTDYPVAITHPEGAFTDIARDAFGKPTAITRRDAGATLAVTRTYTYNEQQELCRSVEPETGATLMGYDDAGNLAWSAAGLPASTACHATGETTAISARRVDRSHDARNRLKTLDFPDGNGNQTWDYFSDGKPRQISTWNIGFPGTDPKETRNIYAYYKRGLLKTELIAVPAWYTFSVEHGYNANGHETSLTYPSGHMVTSTLNALGQPVTIAGSGTTYAAGITYHPNGAVAGFTYGNNVVHAMAQNDRLLPDTVSSIHGGTQFLHDQYDYDGHGNVLDIVDVRPDKAGRRSRSMGYDGLDRLTSIASPMYGSTGANYSYNVLDDLTSLKIGGAQNRSFSYTYDESRRLTRVSRTSTSRVLPLLLSYDAQGNLSSRGDLLRNQLYRFDFGNRLREVEGVEGYRYDGHGRRVLAMNFGSGTVLSQYGLDGRLLYQHSDRTALSTEQVYLGGSLLAIREWPLGGGAATVKYQHTDALGSPVAVTRQDRSIVEETEYEPYGQVLNRPMHDGPGYTGHVEDAATGLVYMQQRYYDPEIGRMLSVDPVTAYGSGDMRHFNPYAYSFNNPYSFMDPDGRQSVKVTTAIPKRELTRADRASINAGNKGQRNYESAALRSGDQRVIDSYMSTKVEYMRQPSADAQSLLDAQGDTADGLRAYREPSAQQITLLPGFGELADSSMAFPEYHGMELGAGGDATVFQVMAHEHGHVLDATNTRPHDREGAASDHSNKMKQHAPPQIKRELRDR